MRFAIAMDVLMVAGVVMLYRAATRPNHPHKRLFVGAFLTLLALCGLAFLAAMVPGTTDRMNWSPVAFGAFGLLASILFLAIAVGIARELRRGTIAGISFRLGGCVLCVMAGLYVVFACVDHYWFFRHSAPAQLPKKRAMLSRAPRIKVCAQEFLDVRTDSRCRSLVQSHLQGAEARKCDRQRT